jgi:hypothetical protein
LGHVILPSIRQNGDKQTEGASGDIQTVAFQLPSKANTFYLFFPVALWPNLLSGLVSGAPLPSHTSSEILITYFIQSPCFSPISSSDGLRFGHTWTLLLLKVWASLDQV